MRHHRRLTLICHGKTESNWPGDDFSRPLRSSGKRLAQKFGSYLAEHGIDDPMLASPAQRTRTSAEKAAKVCGRPTSRVRYERWLYRPALAEQLSILTPYLMRNNLIYFGHPAAMQELMLHLLGPEAMPAQFGLGHLAQLEVELDGSTGRTIEAELSQLLSDLNLPRGFPDPNGSARRSRPAYYYRQSGVLPYRWVSQGPQILLISTRSGRHWGVPKGICEPGLSPQVSAAKEALEEAGVSGPVSDHAFGEYTVGKWGGVCHVQLHAMRVEDEHCPAAHSNGLRARRWQSPQQAAERVRNPELASLIRGFSETLTRNLH